MENFETEYIIYSLFFKVNSDNKVLKDQEYELVSADKEISTGVYTEVGEYGQYYIKDGGYVEESSSDFVVNVLPEFVKAALKNINTLDDVLVFEEFGSENVSVYNSTYSKFVRLTFNVPVKYKQVESSPGYVKQNIYNIAEVIVEFEYDDNNQVINRHIDLRLWYSDYIYEEDFVLADDFSKLYLYGNDADFAEHGYACLNTNVDTIVMPDTEECTVEDSFGSIGFSTVPYFVDQKGTIKFEITNTVNELTKYNASKDKNLEYKINIKNTGDVASGDNVINSYVPVGIEVVEDSISNSGVYNKEKSTITWNVDYIEALEELVVSYKAVAPSESNNKEYIGYSDIVSAQLEKEVQSGNTIVTLDKVIEVVTNPDTDVNMIYIAHTNIGIPVSYLVWFVLVLGIISVVILKKVKKDLE